MVLRTSLCIFHSVSWDVIEREKVHIRSNKSSPTLQIEFFKSNNIVHDFSHCCNSGFLFILAVQIHLLHGPEASSQRRCLGLHKDLVQFSLLTHQLQYMQVSTHPDIRTTKVLFRRIIQLCSVFSTV